MKVSTKSWHYRVIDLLDFCHPHNLCGYCWMTLWALFVLVVVWPIGIALATALVTSPFWFWLAPVYELSILGICVGLMEAALLLGILRAVILDRRYEERRSGTRAKLVIKEPSLFYTWIKAKHDKVCPLIQFESE